jgi:Ketopantoate hydroxymethyltransferase
MRPSISSRPGPACYCWRQYPSNAERITQKLRIPVIGIGAGKHVDGQITVMHDLLGITPPDIKVPKFVTPRCCLRVSQHALPATAAHGYGSISTKSSGQWPPRWQK